MAESKCIVAHFSAGDGTVDLLGWLRDMSAVHDVIWCHFVDMNRDWLNCTEYLPRYHPHAVIIDIAPADLKNWRFIQALCAAPAMKGRGQVLISANKQLDAVLPEDSHSTSMGEP